MKPLEALKMLIREDLTPDDETADLPNLPRAESPPDARGLEQTALGKSYLDGHWKRIIVFKHPGALWEVTPKLVDGRLTGFQFHQMKLVRAGQPIEPSSVEDVNNIEVEFGLDNGPVGPNMIVQ